MVGLNGYHYIVHGFQAHDHIITIDDFCRRESLVTYPRVFRYKQFADNEGYTYFVNEYFSVLCFQNLSTDSIDEARQKYQSVESFDSLYLSAVSSTCERFGMRFKDADFSLSLFLDSSFELGWSECILDRKEPAQLICFIEACFLFQLLTEIRRKVPLITEKRRSFVFQRALVDQAEDLFWAETPSGYLVGDTEIRFMASFYSSWDLGEGIRAMRERFSQSVGNHTFFYDLVSRDREQLLNLLLAAIAIFSAYGVRDAVIKNIPFVAPMAFDLIFLSLFLGLIVCALLVGSSLLGKRLGAWAKWWRNTRRMR